MHPIVFENVNKTYSGKIALQVISLAFPENKTTAVIGPSGSGKSTLIQLINGLIRPDSGALYVFGKKIAVINLHFIEVFSI